MMKPLNLSEYKDEKRVGFWEEQQKIIESNSMKGGASQREACRRAKFFDTLYEGDIDMFVILLDSQPRNNLQNDPNTPIVGLQPPDKRKNSN
jgi:hypothetical protein